MESTEERIILPVPLREWQWPWQYGRRRNTMPKSIKKIAVVIQDMYGSAVIGRAPVDNRSIIITVTSLDKLLKCQIRDNDGTDKVLAMEDYSK
jgi:hypothetical protein